MPGKVLKKNIADVAEALKLKQKNNQSMVLFLGSRAGGLFRSQGFFATLKEYSMRSFDLLSREGQFAESYKALKQDRFNENTIYALLLASLQHVTISQADIYLAEFIKQGLFNVIISTNTDGLLEKALEYVEMRELYEFDVLIPERNATRAEKNSGCTIIKVFGDIYSRVYNVTRRDFYLDSLPDLKTLLENSLARDVLVIGFDPIWDAEILRVFTNDEDIQESFLWLVTEEESLIKHPLVSRTLRRRQTRYIAGNIGGYEPFLKALYVYLYDKMPMHHQTMHEIAISLKSLHSDVHAIQKEISVVQEKLSRYLDSLAQK
ncbi:MAG: hypothetical protein JO011_15805 [Ktedonobacteraceae bacterium]|nr:hypothetical protein [Ktedonobacteraceae bacterium]MBV9712369.1 hypothetical protein [Ktedonobacteraceae bacterium]